MPHPSPTLFPSPSLFPGDTDTPLITLPAIATIAPATSSVTIEDHELSVAATPHTTTAVIDYG